MAIDFKKTQKELYLPGKDPCIVKVPNMPFIAISGSGDPNISPEYAQAVQALYALSYAIRMDKARSGYFEYVVAPLEGLWIAGDGFGSEMPAASGLDKSKFAWTMMIRQPDFASQEAFESALKTAARKKPELGQALDKASFTFLDEGLCAQLMHFGSYDDEPESLARLEAFVAAQGYATQMEGLRQHHEIYLSDPRKTDALKLKTVLRHPIVPVL